MNNLFKAYVNRATHALSQSNRHTLALCSARAPAAEK